MSFVYDMDYKFENCLGNIYARLIENEMNIDSIKTVVEFAPGFRYKIACCLRDIKFNGTLYVIDLNEEVLNYVYETYKKIIPNTNIICLKSNLNDAIYKLPKEKIDLFLSNHCIDDMIIGEFVGNKNRDFAFGNEESSKSYLLQMWHKLENEKDILKSIKNKVYNEIINFIYNTNIELYIFSQYKSAYYIREKSKIEDNAIEIFNNLKKKLKINKEKMIEAMNFYIEDFDEAAEFAELSFRNNIQNIENWIVGRKI